MDVNDTIMHLEDEGYALIEDLVDPEEAKHLEALARRLMEHREGYISMEGSLNHLPEIAPLCMHPLIMELAERILGEGFHLANNVAMKWCKPGARPGGLHCCPADAGGGLPGDPITRLQVFWLLTDYTPENGATRIIPFSQHTGRSPRRDAYPQEIPVIGKRGSVFLFNDCCWHRSGGNTTTDQHRMAACMLYLPAPVETGPGERQMHGWVKRAIYDKFPERLQELFANCVEPEEAPADKEPQMWTVE